ncbi:hypothetical protein F0562_024552 [Nyssa sinensis]|uniref:Uncharacterized protein n=1 Tax=Nyssa sinensis TaxID=561372 RepID=A0A5J5BCU2_9ASTE|nr:hypothetical protein F0562_024552 [Nyssa sinensis]
MSDEEWVKAAMTDDSMVVELLIRLNHATPPKRNSPAFPLDWSVRQRRSKPIFHAKKATTRASPTTPLSWSCATSLSGGAAADGFEESSQPPSKRSDVTRSKVTSTSETTTTKKSRKKKTLAELKEDEILLLKERRQSEEATLRVNLEKQRATNESLKRLKLDLQSQPLAERVTTVAPEETTSNQTQQSASACDPIPSILSPSITGDDLAAVGQPSPPRGLPEVQKGLTLLQEAKFSLPDLNLPLEEDSGSGVL